MTAPVFPAAPADLPSRAEPATFSARTDATIVWEKAFRDVLAGSVSFYEGIVTDSEQAVTDVAAQVTLAVEQVGLARDQVALAVTQVGLADAQRVLAQAAAAAAASSANFVGAWSGLTGALNIPASVSHSGSIWNLNVNLANVTTSEPASANGDWTVSGFSGVYADLSGKPTLGTAAAFDKSLFGGN